MDDFSEPRKKLEYRICTLSYNSEAFCSGDCENCGLYKQYKEQYADSKNIKRRKKWKNKHSCKN